MSNPYNPMDPTFATDPTFAADPSYEPSPVALRHSGAGIASFIIALAVGLVELVGVIGAGVMVSRNPDVANDSPVAMSLGLAICGGVLLGLVGVVLGIVGLVMRQRRRVFAIIGLVINGLILVGIGGLMVLGLMAKN